MKELGFREANGRKHYLEEQIGRLAAAGTFREQIIGPERKQVCKASEHP